MPQISPIIWTTISISTLIILFILINTITNEQNSITNSLSSTSPVNNNNWTW